MKDLILPPIGENKETQEPIKYRQRLFSCGPHSTVKKTSSQIKHDKRKNAALKLFLAEHRRNDHLADVSRRAREIRTGFRSDFKKSQSYERGLMDEEQAHADYLIKRIKEMQRKEANQKHEKIVRKMTIFQAREKARKATMQARSQSSGGTMDSDNSCSDDDSNMFTVPITPSKSGKLTAKFTDTNLPEHLHWTHELFKEEAVEKRRQRRMSIMNHQTHEYIRLM